ncbi:MAG: alpha/beta hydrolase [Chloroflexi bacterium]|nr:alpha/beta hydrolase [Chloroflexota bacterium]
MPVIGANGATIDYADTGGEGAPLVLIHGWLGSWDDLLPEFDWLRAGGYRVLAPSRRGYARSGPKPRDYPRDFYRRDAEDLAAWLDALDVRGAHIVGYSDGGEVALLLPIIRPDLVRSVVTWGAVGHFTPDLRVFVHRKYPPTWVDDHTRALHGPEHINRMVLGWVTAMKQIIDSGGDVSYGAADQIACPLLLMLGRSDTLNPIVLGQAFVERAPHARLALFDCGHAIHRELPDAFRTTVSEFLRAVERDTV